MKIARAADWPHFPAVRQTFPAIDYAPVPQVIQTEKQYREIGSRFGELVGKGRARTQNETRLMRLLALLIEDYDRRNAMPSDNATPVERLRFLLEHSGKTPGVLDDGRNIEAARLLHDPWIKPTFHQAK